jgi:Protein O-mannosyl-transferase TMEM260-like
MPLAGEVMTASWQEVAARDRLAHAAVVWGVPALVAVVVVANAASGVMPGVGFWDTGEFQTVLPIMGTAHPTGFPTYVLLGWVANLLMTPLGAPAFRINVLSLVAVAAAAGVTVGLVRRLTGSTILGAAAGLGLALAPVVWTNATRADPHPIHLAFVAILLFVLVTWEQKHRRGDADSDRWLVAAAVVFGLAMGNHSLTLLLAVPVALFVLATEPRIIVRGRLVVACVAALAVTLVLVYLELPLRSGVFPAPLVYAKPDTWSGFWYIAAAEQFRGSLGDPFAHLDAKLGDLGDLTWNEFGILAVAIIPGFLATLRLAPRYALLTGTAMVITLLFNAAYANADILRYYLGPVLWAWTWLAMLGAVIVEQALALVAGPAPDSDAVAGASTDANASAGHSGARLAWPGVAAAAVVSIGLLVPSLLGSSTVRAMADRSRDTEARTWVDEALTAVAPNAVLVSWWATSTPLWYAQKVQGERTDVFIVDDRTMLDLDLGGATDVIGANLGHRPVYVIRANPHDLGLVTALFQIQPVLDAAGRPIGAGATALYQVVGRAGG